LFIRSLTIGALILTSVVGCGGADQAEETTPSTGGAGGAVTPGAGSASAQNGGASVGAGGATEAGGSAVGAGGVVTGAGGSVAAGGTVATGGAAGAGGMPADAQSITLTMDSFSVPPGGEFYKCQDFPNTFGKNIAILESKSQMTPGSHHLFVFRLSSDGFYGGASNLGPNNTKGPLVDCPSGGTEFHPYVHAAQTPIQDNTFPAGVGEAFNTGETIRVMVHYLNTGSDMIMANTNVTLTYVPATEVQQLAASIFLNSVGIKVPVGKTTQSYSFALPMDIQLIGASGHMHRRGVHFVGTAVKMDGTKQMLYQTDTWDEPMAAAFNPAIKLANGTTVQWACSYNNDTGRSLSFGESASTNEMCIFTGTFYPAPNGDGLYDQDLGRGTSTQN
jgi:hypothetical protein